MALIHARSDGTVFRVTKYPHQDDRYRGRADAAHELEVDYATNAQIIDQVSANVAGYTVSGGALYKDGQPVAIAPDSDAKAIERLTRSLGPQARTGGRQAAKAVVQAALNNEAATAQQLTRALAYALLRGFLGDDGS